MNSNPIELTRAYAKSLGLIVTSTKTTLKIRRRKQRKSSWKPKQNTLGPTLDALKLDPQTAVTIGGLIQSLGIERSRRTEMLVSNHLKANGWKRVRINTTCGREWSYCRAK